MPNGLGQRLGRGSATTLTDDSYCIVPCSLLECHAASGRSLSEENRHDHQDNDEEELVQTKARRKFLGGVAAAPAVTLLLSASAIPTEVQAAYAVDTSQHVFDQY
jgi:hypothetical protein